MDSTPQPDDSMPGPFLPYLPVDLIERAFRRSPGHELERKLMSPRSSAALAANAFGLFLPEGKAALLPPIPGTSEMGWPARRVDIERSLRFPWRGGLHPWLDVVVETPTHVIGIESKRYEPFDRPPTGRFSEIFARRDWGVRMTGYTALRDRILAGDSALACLDAAQLVKHAFALASEAVRRNGEVQAVLVYLHADPAAWPDGKPIPDIDRQRHRQSIEYFAALVQGDAVPFVSLTYTELLAVWESEGDAIVRSHARQVRERFRI